MPRISVSLNKHQFEVIETISSAQGASMSSVMADLVDMALPVLERTAATMQRLKNFNDERKQAILKSMDEAQTTLEPMMDAVLGQYDIFLSETENAAIGSAGRGSVGDSDAPRQRSRNAQDPRPVTTGVNAKTKRAPSRSAKVPKS